jgi:hypothetical protein
MFGKLGIGEREQTLKTFGRQASDPKVHGWSSLRVDDILSAFEWPAHPIPMTAAKSEARPPGQLTSSAGKPSETPI